MAEENKKAAKETEGETPPKKSKMKLIIIIVAAVVVLGGGGAGAFLFLGGDHAAAETKADAHGGGPDEVKAEPKEIGPIHSLESFIVNLADDESSRYLKLTIHLELRNKLIADGIEKRSPQIRDSLLTLLTSKTYQQVADTKGKVKLRKEMIHRLNDILGEGAVTHVYFTEFIVQ